MKICMPFSGKPEAPVCGTGASGLPLNGLLAVWFVLIAPLAARAAAPTVTYLFPAGAQRGTSVDVTAAGTFDPWPVEAWCSAKGVEIRSGKTKGSLQVTVAPDVSPGTCWLRLHNADGASRLCPFIIGTLLEVLEKEPNDDPRKPQPLPISECVVNGRVATNQDVDHFALALRKGQTLVASLMANRVLGSPMDGVLQILSPDGFVVAENNDFHGLDPQVAYTVLRDGTYVVRVFAFPATPDASIRFAGGETFLYRLTLTTGAFADHVFPLAVSRGEKTQVRLLGWNLPDTAQVEVGPETPSVRVEPHPTMVEQKPNSHDKPQPIELPVTVSGHIDPPGDRDVYGFQARKGQKLTFQVEARSLGSPLDAVLRITDAAGKTLQEVDDTGRSVDPELSFTVPADGSFHVEVRDLHNDGGWRFFYRLRAVPAEPDFALTVAAGAFVSGPGQALDMPVTIVRQNGFAGPVEIKLDGLPEDTPAVSASAGGKTATLKIPAVATPFRGPIRVLGQAPGLPPRIARAVNADTDLLWLTLRPAATPGK